MAKKKNKQSKQSKLKIANAQQRNDFFKRLDIYCKCMTGENILKLIPRDELNKIYLTRSRSITIEPEDGQELPANLMEAIKALVNACIKQITIPICYIF